MGVCRVYETVEIKKNNRKIVGKKSERLQNTEGKYVIGKTVEN